MTATDMAASAAAADTPESRTLRIVRTYDAPREAVFRAWTVPEQIASWWGPEGVNCPEYRFDVRPGGEWRTVMRNAEGGEHVACGQFREITPPDRLIMTWAWETDGVRGHETILTIDLRDVDGRTELTLTQALFESVESRDNHDGGWTSSLKKFDAYMAANA